MLHIILGFLYHRLILFIIVRSYLGILIIVDYFLTENSICFVAIALIHQIKILIFGLNLM